ncbi:class I mannose-6-phosphate isomerase [Negadavirga shengliensis]|uniref:Class I mannose-6-phosphate isomerase n=1 Tax=Negadavirga shengliensis TaxID=1389218 RepID=A0ABV9T162_9BACT
MIKSNFDKFPVIAVEDQEDHCHTGWDKICKAINEKIIHKRKTSGKVLLIIDCYQGVYHEDLASNFRERLNYNHFLHTHDIFKSEKDIREMIHPDLTDDRIFGRITSLDIHDYFKAPAFEKARANVAGFDGTIVIYGEGAAAIAGPGDILVYADMARWEIQMRMRRNEVDNLGVNNRKDEFSLQYKQGYFIDWRVLDKHKQSLMDKWNYVLDTNNRQTPKLAPADAVMKGLEIASKSPFRVVPFFDPGPWGGQWMKEVCDLDRSAENYAWCFDCVPEENSLLLKFGELVFEIPSINLVFAHPEKLLGKQVHQRFGKEFPIRFDLLDTIDGGNLSLQVHPTREYIKQKFGLEYTQDESYYMLDVKDDAVVYLGLKEGIDPDKMIDQLEKAQNGSSFDADGFVNKWKVNKHDHVPIPAGTVHCSGKNSMVLEISATPYIFTFKLWDWDRLGLDGKPRPIHINHGKHVIQWDRTTEWTKKNLLNGVEKIAEGDGWVEEKTGLHASQFIETRRHWFTKKVYHDTGGGVNILNLVEGREAIVESPTGDFEPFVVHYAETFIVPAAVGAYTIKPHGESEGRKCGTIKAFVRIE